MGVDHQQLGAGLTEAWKFPRPANWLPATSSAGGAAGDRVLVSLVYVADTMTASFPRALISPLRNDLLIRAILAELNIDPATVEQIRATLPETIANASALFV